MDTINISPDVFDRRHPFYNARLVHWKFVNATFKGGRDWFDENIHKYHREGSGEYKDRLSRAYRFNHTKEVVNLVTKYVFQGDVDRSEDAPEQVKKFWKSAMRRGGDINRFMRKVSDAMAVFGQPYVVVDSSAKPPEEGGAKNRFEEAKSDDRAYVYIVSPVDALDMSFDDNGRLNWFLHVETVRKDEEFFTKTHETVKRYRLWTKNHCHVFEIKDVEGGVPSVGVPTTVDPTIVFNPSSLTSADTKTKSRKAVVLVNTIDHGIGEVPVIPASEFDSDTNFAAPGLIDDIAYLDRAVANYLSNLDAIIQDQTFSTLTIPSSSLDAEEGDYERLIEMGTNRIFAYDSEGGSGPAYISPDPTQAQIIVEVITKIITEIYHSVGMAGERTKMDNAAGIDNSSGVAKAYDFDRMNTTLKSKADRLQHVEREIARMVMLWHGKNIDEESMTRLVRYPQDFDTRNLYDEFDVANRLLLLDAPKEMRTHQFTLLIDKLFPTLKKGLRKKILSQLEEWAEETSQQNVTSASLLQDRNVPASENTQGQNNKDEAPE